MRDVDYLVNLILARCDGLDENTLAEVEARLRVRPSIELPGLHRKIDSIIFAGIGNKPPLLEVFLLTAISAARRTSR
jgi:hypothetical protein